MDLSYCQIVSPINMIKRLMYSHFAITFKMTYENCIFIDESKIVLLVHECTM